MSIKSSIIFLVIIFKVMALITVEDIGILPLVENSIGITFFVDITNEDRQDTCKLCSQCKRCCFIDRKNEYCNVTVAFGDDDHIVKPRDRKTLLYVAPMLTQHDLIGYCEFLITYDYNNTQEEIDITIPFDTRVGVKKTKELVNQYVGNKKIKVCNTLDEDSLNNCEPVDCYIKYLDKRPIFDYILNKCVEAPVCLTNPDRELPDNVYLPTSNICRNLDMPLTVQDIYAISTGLGTKMMTLDLTSPVKVNVKSNCTTISQNLSLLRDFMLGKMCALDNEITIDYSECLKSALLTIGVCILSICSILFILICCVNSTIWLFIQWSDGNLSDLWKTLFKNPFKKKKSKKSKGDKINSTIRNALLRDVIVKDVPLELRNSVIDVCDRMGREIKRKKRYRGVDVGSQISLQRNSESLSSSMSSATSLGNDKE